MRDPRTARRERWLAGLLLAVALTAATYPAWRVLLLGSRPTIDELLALRCSAARPAR